MLVRFLSSETGELLMFAQAARTLLQAIGKETTARGTFTQAEMQLAADALRAYVHGLAAEPVEEASDPPAEAVVGLGPRAWPLVDMLERTARGGPRANIVWQAPSAF